MTHWHLPSFTRTEGKCRSQNRHDECHKKIPYQHLNVHDMYSGPLVCSSDALYWCTAGLLQMQKSAWVVSAFKCEKEHVGMPKVWNEKGRILVTSMDCRVYVIFECPHAPINTIFFL